MIHHGRFLEDILPDPRDRARLFRELQCYTGKVIDDFVKRKTQTWSEIEEYRRKRREELSANRE